MLGQHGADRLDTPDQATGLAVAVVGADELHDQWCGRSSSAAKKVEAALRMALARFSSAFSRRSRFSSADSSLVVPGPPAAVDLGLTDPLAHRLRRPDPEQPGDLTHRRPLRLVLHRRSRRPSGPPAHAARADTSSTYFLT